MSDVGLVVGWCDPGDVKGPFAYSLSKLVAYEAANRRLVSTIRVQSGPSLDRGRNALVRTFLDLPAGATHLLMVDADMTFDMNAAERLLDRDLELVGGLCFGINSEVGIFPTIFYAGPEGPVNPYTGRTPLPDSPLVQVDATGAAFLLIRRDVLEEIGDGWFDRSPDPATGKPLGEDLSFCYRAHDHGFRTFVDTTLEVGHVRDTIVGVDAYERR